MDSFVGDNDEQAGTLAANVLWTVATTMRCQRDRVYELQFRQHLKTFMFASY